MSEGTFIVFAGYSRAYGFWERYHIQKKFSIYIDMGFSRHIVALILMLCEKRSRMMDFTERCWKQIRKKQLKCGANLVKHALSDDDVVENKEGAIHR